MSMNLSPRSSLEATPLQNPAEVVARWAAQIPPINLMGMSRELGLGFAIEGLPAGISGKLTRDQNYSGGFKISVNAADPPRRQRFTTAHEIAHFVLHRDLIGDGITDNAMYRSSLSDEYERQADRFAAQMLLPAEAVRAAYRNTKALAGLSVMFDVSGDAIRIRLRELRLDP